MSKIGIDFGTSFCTAAIIDPATKRPAAVQFYKNSNVKLPSVVYYGDGNTIVGQAAYDQLENSIHMTSEEDRVYVLSSVITSIKRRMRPGQNIHLPDGRLKTHEDVIADIIKEIKSEVEQHCFNSQKVNDVVLTHPVNFDMAKKEMLKKAAGIAGFSSVELMEEPVAAALGYASTVNACGSGILIYDFGGGTFDAAFVVREPDGTYRTPIRPVGDQQCGGDDIDRIIYDMWNAQAKTAINRGITVVNESVDLGFLASCRKQKESVAIGNFDSYKFPMTLPPPGVNRMELSITKAEFNKAIQHIIDKTMVHVERLVSLVKSEGYKIDTAVMIGGSSRIPLVYERLKNVLPVVPTRTMNVDTAVALGAALGNIVMPDGPKKCYCIKCGCEMLTSDKFCMKDGTPNYRYNKA